MSINQFTDALGQEAQRLESNKIIDEQIARDAIFNAHIHTQSRMKHHQITAPVKDENFTLMGF